jgi:RimJ/RimL family protein N-acetyltransferase
MPVNTSPAPRPQRVQLGGARVTLVPLDAALHADALAEGACGPGSESLWTYLFEGPFRDPAQFRAHIENKAASQDPLFFAIVGNETRRATGYASLMRIEPAHRCIEVGSILYTPKLQRTPAATEAMFLLARYVFEDLGYRRYEWKCNSLNQPSLRAALRLGFIFEGVFRQHMIVKGQNRDTAWFSMLDHEWPTRKAAFERWLAPSNFDENGVQRTALGA